jgi:putative ABC transport system ATP-binding protein
MAMIEATNLTKIYGKGETAVTALSHVDLSLNAGEFAAVMGPSGCGKSTLLHLLGGLDRPTEGSVTIDGHNLTQLSDQALTELRRRKIGFNFQFINPSPLLNSVQNAALTLTLDGASQEKSRARATEWLQRGHLFRSLHALTAQRARLNPKTALAQMLLHDKGIMHLEADLRWLDMIEARLEDVRRQPLPQPEPRPRGRPRKAGQPAPAGELQAKSV